MNVPKSSTMAARQKKHMLQLWTFLELVTFNIRVQYTLFNSQN